MAERDSFRPLFSKKEKEKTAVAIAYEPGDAAPKILATGKGEVAEKNMVFTGAKSAVDLWNISDDEFRVYELKTENKMVGIVTEAFFYSNYFYDFLVSGAFTLNRGAECDRGYPELLSSKINKIVGVLLADEFHPLINSETVKLLNGNNLNIEYVSARYCLEQTLR